MKKIIVCLIAIFSIIPIAPIFADELDEDVQKPPLFISAFNAGFKNDLSAQNNDFIEITQSGENPLSLAGIQIIYNNSSDNKAGEIAFGDSQVLNGKRIVLGYAKSPQFFDWSDTHYVYDFGSSGMASTAGRLKLLINGELIDEVCWGKIACHNKNPKFATAEDDNYSYVRDDYVQSFTLQKYYPNIEGVMSEPIVDNPDYAVCNITITEIFSYYADNQSEQFIELYNPTDADQDLSLCSISYKGKDYTVDGILLPNSYYVFQDSNLVLTKDPSTLNTILIGDAEFILPHGQKKSTSYALFNYGTTDEKWLQTYALTPGSDNIYQEFRTCEEGKIINPETGNCVKENEKEEIVCPEGKYLNLLTGRCKTIEVSKTTTCKDGYYLNQLTGRCKKIETADVKECAEGYERNPETNRCRKIRKNTGAEYPVADPPDAEYQNPKLFIATGSIIILALLGLAYVVFQYRKEIKRGILKICRRNVS